MKKKILSLLLAVVMMLSLGVTARAATPTPTDVSATTTLAKSYTGTGAPTETFYLEQVGSVTVTENSNVTTSEIAGLNLDEITVSGVTADADCTLVAQAENVTVSSTNAVFTIGLPQYTKVGVYTYQLKEINSGTSGVTYYSNTIYMVVTVTDTNGVLSPTVAYYSTSNTSSTENKISSITNTYASGNLSVSKTVSGNLGDKSSDNTFSFTVTFTAPSGTTWDGTGVTQTVGSETTDISLTAITNGSVYYYTFTLYHGQTITFGNLPDGVSYKVVENDTTTTTTTEGEVETTTITTITDNYTVTYDTKETGTISSSTTASTTITNTKEGDVDTGVILDSAPYILILIVVVAGAVIMITRKRRNEDF